MLKSPTQPTPSLCFGKFSGEFFHTRIIDGSPLSLLKYIISLHVNLTDEEKKAFFDKYIKPARLHIDDSGDVKIELNSWK